MAHIFNLTVIMKTICNISLPVCIQSYTKLMRMYSTAWFLAVQIMITLSLMLHMVTIVFNILYFVHCCPQEKERNYVLATSVMNFLAGKSCLLTLFIHDWHKSDNRKMNIFLCSFLSNHYVMSNY